MLELAWAVSIDARTRSASFTSSCSVCNSNSWLSAAAAETRGWQSSNTNGGDPQHSTACQAGRTLLVGEILAEMLAKRVLPTAAATHTDTYQRAVNSAINKQQAWSNHDCELLSAEEALQHDANSCRNIGDRSSAEGGLRTNVQVVIIDIMTQVDLRQLIAAAQCVAVTRACASDMRMMLSMWRTAMGIPPVTWRTGATAAVAKGWDRAASGP